MRSLNINNKMINKIIKERNQSKPNIRNQIHKNHHL
jgi:hypothetical protein